MRIKIIQIGKTKEKYLQEGCGEFLKRVSPFADVEVVTLKECVASRTFTGERCKEDEGSLILKNVKEGEFLVALDEGGRQIDSVSFAKFLGEFKDSGQTLCFIVGGPYGLSEKVKSSANQLLSFSKMTFTHQMIRMFLLEQIYRGLSILNGKGYHNE